MHVFDVLGNPVRRRILELLAEGDHTSGTIVASVQREFPISQPAVAQHLRVLRESGFATVRSAGTQRIYVVDALPLEEVDSWLMRFRQLWEERLDELGEEVTRGRAEQAASDAPDG